MTLDDLEKEFWGDQREQPTRVRLARVVTALRDEIASQFGFNESWNVGAVVGAFDDILGCNAEGQEGGGLTEPLVADAAVATAPPSAAPDFLDECEPGSFEVWLSLQRRKSPAADLVRHLTPQEQGIFHSALRRSVKAAGGPARKDGKAVEAAGDKGPATVNSPAADPVCEWRAGRDGIQAVAACGIPNNYWLETAKRLGVKTCACGRPISFKEAAR